MERIDPKRTKDRVSKMTNALQAVIYGCFLFIGLVVGYFLGQVIGGKKDV